MKIILVFFSVVFFPSYLIAQADRVITEIDDAFEEYESAFKKIQQGIYYINRAFEQSTISDIQYEASYAQSEL